jgi:HlyD family secretion protein
MKRKKWIVLTSFLVIVVLCFIAMNLFNKTEKKEYQTYKVSSRSLVNTINTNGNLSRVNTTKIKASLGEIKLGEVFAQEGDLVKEGDKLVEINISSLEHLLKNYEDLSYKYKEELNQQTETKWETTVKATTSGRIKFIASDKGDENLLILSLNGKMKVVFNSTSELSIGSKVTIKTSTDDEYEGIVREKNKEQYIAEITDNGPKYKDKVTVWSSKNKIGESELLIDMPFMITGDYSNVESFSVTDNENITNGTELLKWKKRIISQAYSTIYNNLHEAENKLDEIKKLQATPFIVAESSGVISEFRVKEGDYLPDDDNVIIGEILENELEFVALINEKYIMSLEEGMKATLYLTALNGEKIETSISEIGKMAEIVGEAAYFKVKFKLSSRDGLYEGMSGKIEIILEESNTGVVIPLGLLNQDSDGSEFVYIADNSSEDSRKKVIVETGIANEDYVQILSGLSEGDLISYEGNLLAGIAE